MTSKHPITAEKVLKFLRRNGYDMLPTYTTVGVCNIVVSADLSLCVNSPQNGTATVEVVCNDGQSAIISPLFATMEDFVEYFLTLGSRR